MTHLPADGYTPAMGKGGGGDTLLSIGEAAKILGISPQQVRNLTADGKLSEAMRVGGRRVYKRADVERLKRQREKARP